MVHLKPTGASYVYGEHPLNESVWDVPRLEKCGNGPVVSTAIHRVSRETFGRA